MAKLNENNYPVYLLILFIFFFLLLAIKPYDRFDWFLENILTLIFLVIIIWSYKYFRFSNISYTFIFIFMTLHIIGAHYTYSQTPIGFFFQGLFNGARNHYDRLVHFSFGLLFAYPIREVFLRIVSTKGIWGYYLPVELTLATSALYELIEWGTVMVVDPNAGIAFLGTQGDPWDAQKDMALATLGSLIAMGVTLLINMKGNRKFVRELKSSLKIRRRPLREI